MAGSLYGGHHIWLQCISTVTKTSIFQIVLIDLKMVANFRVLKNVAVVSTARPSGMMNLPIFNIILNYMSIDCNIQYHCWYNRSADKILHQFIYTSRSNHLRLYKLSHRYSPSQIKINIITLIEWIPLPVNITVLVIVRCQTQRGSQLGRTCFLYHQFHFWMAIL